MDWTDVAKTAGDIGLKVIGTALGGPAGAGIASSLAQSLGLESTASPDVVNTALAAADPATMVKLKAIEADIAKAKIGLQSTELTTFAAVQASLAQADAAGSSTRPKIAENMSRLLIFETVALTLAVIAAIFLKPTALNDLSSAWPIIGSVFAAPVTIVYQYFGKRTTEKTARYNMAIGQSTVKPAGMISAMASVISGKK